MSSRFVSWLVCAVVLLVAAAAAPGVAATAPTAAAAAVENEPQPQTVSADALPTVQIDGVAWKQVIVGNTVYVGGEFTMARPAGAAAGTDTTPRSNMLAYDIRTGELVDGFAPSFNGKVSDIAATPDGSKLVVVGAFTAVNDKPRYRVAVLNLPDGSLAAPGPTLDAPAQSVAVTSSTVWIGGYFSRAGNQARPRVAAFSLADSSVLPFSLPVDDGQVQSMVLSPDASQLVIAGNFTSVGGSNRPGYGLYRADAVTGTGLPLPVNDRIRNAGPNSAILRVASDGDSFYGAGYNFGKTGTTEGMFRASWTDGALVNIEDCHGDTYDIAPVGEVVYSASHKHYCGNSGGFPQTTPWSYAHSTAWTKATEGSNHPDIYGYPAHPGTPRPGLLPWFPKTDAGNFTGAAQAVWTVTGNADYVLYGGEFPRVNGQAQQGLVRYAVRPLAPNKQGPRPTTGFTFAPSVRAMRTGEVRVTWPAMWDRDDATLTYRVSRDTVSNVVHEVRQTNSFWDGRAMSFTDSGLVPGTATRYAVRVTDASGNLFSSGWINVTVADSNTLSDYGDAVLDDGASTFWPLDEPAGSASVVDLAGADATTAGAGVTRGVAGPIAGSAASSFNATVSALVAGNDFRDAPDVFSQEVWFKTTSAAGGKISGFGSSRTGDSGSYDRHVFMDTAGRVVFGVSAGGSQTVSSATGYNNGQWHHVVATLGLDGMQLYVDGKRVGARSSVTAGARYPGFWRVGGDRTWSGGKYFDGQIANFAVYPAVLGPRKVNAHWVLSGRPSALPGRPADSLGRAVFDSAPELYWRLNDATATASDSALGMNAGAYTGNYTQRQAGVQPEDTSALLRAPSRTILRVTPAGTVTQSAATTSPSRFTQEAWVKTTASSGGRVFGFGNTAGTSTSTTQDRALWLTDAGKVRFGVDSSSRVQVESSTSVNDGAWHQLVSTFDPAEGMKLYVDGRLEASAAHGTAPSYPGYWRVGADATWGGNSSSHLLGQVDEAAVWTRALSAAEVRSHFVAGGGVIPNAAPAAAFTADVTDLDLSVDASGSSDPEGGPLSYSWDFGDGSTGTGRTAQHQYAKAGTFTVRLTVTDAAGGTDRETTEVVAVRPNELPSAAFTQVAANLRVAFDARASVDADGSVRSHEWDFGDGRTGAGATVEHSYAEGGTYTVRLTVVDDRGGRDSVTRQVTVAPPNAAPTASFVASASGLGVTVDGGGSADPDGSVASYSWSWGDGSADGSGRSASHTYATAGEKTVVLTVTDDDGATATTTRTIMVVRTNAAPTASFTVGASGLGVSVDGGGSADPDGSVASYSWSWGDGSADGSGRSASHTYATAGEKTVVLTVTDDAGETATTRRAVTLEEPLPAGTLARDGFDRTLSSGWGTAEAGGAWTVTGGTSRFSVGSSAGVIAAPAGQTMTADLAAMSSAETVVMTEFSVDKLAEGQYIVLRGRRIGANSYDVRLRIGANGAVRMWLLRNNSTAIGTAFNAPFLLVPGEKYSLKLSVRGTSPTTLAAKVWPSTTQEPAWQRTAADNAVGLQAPGSAGLLTWVPNAAAVSSVTTAFHGFRVTESE